MAPLFRARDTKLDREGRAENSPPTRSPARGPATAIRARGADIGLAQPTPQPVSRPDQGDSRDRRREADRAGVADVGLPERVRELPVAPNPFACWHLRNAFDICTADELTRAKADSHLLPILHDGQSAVASAGARKAWHGTGDSRDCSKRLATVRKLRVRWASLPSVSSRRRNAAICSQERGAMLPIAPVVDGRDRAMTANNEN